MAEPHIHIVDSITRAKCPFCDLDVALTADKPPMLIHQLPPCDRFGTTPKAEVLRLAGLGWKPHPGA